MKSLFAGAIAALAMLAESAGAAWGLRFDVSTDAGATWHSSISIKVGQIATFRFGAYADASTMVSSTSGTGIAHTLARFVGQNKVDGMGDFDKIQNLVRTTTNGNAAVLAISGNLIGTTARTSFASNLYVHGIPATRNTYTPIYTGEIAIAAATGPARTMTIMSSSFGADSLSGLTFFNGSQLQKQESGAPIQPPAREDINATIEVLDSTVTVPVPASIIPLALLLAARHRTR
ncbi:MAG: hypothetical protein ACREJD_04340 [Phycisphaerales bacterium]